MTRRLPVLLIAVSMERPAQAAATCQGLMSLSRPGATITSAREVDSACQVTATLRPSGDSDISIEIWMPAANWNGKFQAVGNGAFNGTINRPAMTAAIKRGYATASTDTGHVGGGASFALGHPEKVIDFGWRAVHEMTVTSKQIIAAYYESGPPGWSIDRFNVTTDIVRAEETDRDTLNALDPDLRAFFDRGGKLIQYHGWSDPQISPGSSVQYYERVAEALGGLSKIQSSHRLFMAPGMAHCGGGEGPDAFDMVSALEQWVEKGQAPDRIIASRLINGVVDRTRPLCPYPQVAIYKGAGSADVADNFVCSAPGPR